MGGKSVFSNVMLCAIAVILAVGFYLMIGAVDVFRLREEKLVTEVTGLRSEMTRLRETVERGGFSVSSTGTFGSDSGNRVKFANEDLRDPNAVDGDAIVAVTPTVTSNMNYIINNDGFLGDLWGYTFDSLAMRNYEDPTVFEPQLAESWEISDDRLHYTIHLRKGVLWHDFADPTTGERFEDVEVTADDFRFYIDVIRNEKIACEPLRGYFKDLDGIRVIDKYTFEVVWKEPYFLSESWSLGLIPLPRHFYRFDPEKADKEFDENFERNRMIVGCGPWVFEEWEKGKRIVLRRNEKYYGLKPHLKRRVIKIIKEPTARLQALRKGELDLMALQPEQWVNQTSDAEFKAQFNKLTYSRQFYYYIGYNQRNDLFKSREVRTALTHLVDRERMVKDVFLGLATITTGNFYINSPCYDKSIKPYPFDIEKAVAILNKAGWRDTDGDGVLDKDGRKFEFTFLTVSGIKTLGRIAEIVKDDFAKAGIIVNINPIEWSVYTERLDEKSFDVCALGWGSDAWESDPYQLWHSSGADVPKTSNYVGFKNAEADNIIETARREFDVEKRILLYHRFHQIMHEEQPYTFLVAPSSLVAIDKRFRNVKIYPHPKRTDSNSFWVPLAEQKYR